MDKTLYSAYIHRYPTLGVSRILCLRIFTRSEFPKQIHIYSALINIFRLFYTHRAQRKNILVQALLQQLGAGQLAKNQCIWQHAQRKKLKSIICAKYISASETKFGKCLIVKFLRTLKKLEIPRLQQYAVVKYVKHIRLLLISDYIFLSKKKKFKSLY